MIAQTEEGAERLITEALYGDAESFWKLIERGHGKTPMVVEVDERKTFAIDLDGVSDVVLEIVAALVGGGARQAKVGVIEAIASEAAEIQGLPSTSGKASYVNSDASKEPVKRPRF